MFVTAQNGLTYKNKYCALCNGVTVFSAWNIAFFVRLTEAGNCSVNLIERESVANYSLHELAEQFLRNCSYNLLPLANPSPRFCFRWREKINDCKDYPYQNVVYTGNEIHRNIDCCYEFENHSSCTNGEFNCGIYDHHFLTNRLFSVNVLNFVLGRNEEPYMTVRFDMNKEDVICTQQVSAR